MIKILDNLFTYEENIILYNFFLAQNFYYGEIDDLHTPPTGLISSLDLHSEVTKNLHSKLPDFLKFELLSRAYVNLFLPNEKPFFHPDGDVITALFYFLPFVDLNEGGETQFLINNQITGILPKPSRLVIFDGNIIHKATSFRSRPRITVALKFQKGGEQHW